MSIGNHAGGSSSFCRPELRPREIPAIAVKVTPRAVDDHAVQPGREGGLAAKTAQSSPRADEAVLHHVRRIAWVADDPAGRRDVVAARNAAQSRRRPAGHRQRIPPLVGHRRARAAGGGSMPVGQDGPVGSVQFSESCAFCAPCSQAEARLDVRVALPLCERHGPVSSRSTGGKSTGMSEMW